MLSLTLQMQKYMIQLLYNLMVNTSSTVQI